MSTLVVYSDAADGQIQSRNANYATARSGGTLTASTAAAQTVFGQSIPATYYLFETFLSFDTSSVGSESTVTAAVLNLTAGTSVADSTFTIEARLRDWGTSLTTGDWVAGASLSGLTLLAHRATASGWVANTAYDLTDDALPANVSKTGSTRLLLCSDGLTAGSAPVDSAVVGCYAADEAGTTKDPKLTVTYEAASSLPVWAQAVVIG